MTASESIQLTFEPLVELKTGRTTAFHVRSVPQPVTHSYADGRRNEPEPGREDNPDRHCDTPELTQACEQLKAWNDAGIDISFRVPISAEMLASESLLDEFQQIGRQTGVDFGNLELGVTPSMLLRSFDASIKNAKGLEEMGIALSQLGLGRGYSSLAALTALPFRSGEVSNHLLQDADNHLQSHAVATAFLSTFKSLGLRAVAEGVQRESTARVLAELGYELARGSLFGPPMGSAIAQHWLAQRPGQADA
jgi:EAL domain-containing protein (putative c-di-GMP-specific phosphodiesterase class I)